MRNDTSYTEEQRDEVKERMKRLNDELNARQDSINLLKGKLQNQITNVKETLAKVLDEDTTLAEKVRTLFREQGITIASILTAFGAVIASLVEGFTGGGGSTTLPPKPDHSGGDGDAKKWIKNKLKALASLFSRLAAKAGEALPGILGSIISWVLSRAKEAVGWLAQNLWALLVGVAGLLYTYIITRRN